MSQRAMTVAGVMSGTSADGIDVAIVRVSPGKPRPKLALLAHEHFAYPDALRKVSSCRNECSSRLRRQSWRG